LLRATVGILAGVQGSLYLIHSDRASFVVRGLGLLMILSGAGLFFGLFTQPLALLPGLASLAMLFGWLPSGLQNILTGRLSSLLEVVMILTIILLGPGAFSLDARLFGRREIIIPPVNRPPGA
jgi:uncharacterized membrane protein YphA (DoxX/SURF4 family)